MSTSTRLLVMFLGAALFTYAQTNNQSTPVWWAKYQYLRANVADSGTGASNSVVIGSNVDVSNECGPQSETYITLNPSRPSTLAIRSAKHFLLSRALPP